MPFTRNVSVAVMTLLILAAAAFADNNWLADGARSDNYWSNPANWSYGVPSTAGLSEGYVNIGHDCCQPQTVGPVIDGPAEANYLRMRSRQNNDYTVTVTPSGSLAVTWAVTIGYDTHTYGPRTLTLDVEGTLKTRELTIGEPPYVSDPAGVTTFSEGTAGVCNINDGVVTVTGESPRLFQIVNRTSADKSYVNINGDGRLRLRGDWVDESSCERRPRLDDYLAEGNITGSGPLAMYLVYIGGELYTEIAVGGSIQFDSDASGQHENASTTVEVPVTLGRALHGDVYTVQYSVTGGTATAADYTLAAGTLTFAAGETLKTIEIDIAQDGLDEPDETIVVSLSNPTGPNARPGENNSHVFTIMDPRPTVAFEAAYSSVPQNTQTPAGLAVILSNDIFTETVTVDYSVTGGTATAGSDYQLAAGTLTFTAGETRKTIEVTIIDDGSYEAVDETVTVSLSSPAHAHMGSISDHTMVITDPRVELAFAESSSGVSEAASQGDVAVTLSGPTGDTVTVDYAVTGGTATEGIDYTIDGSGLTFEPGETVKYISVTTVDDGIGDGEGDETVIIGLSNLTGDLVSFGANTSHTHTILDEALMLDYLKVDLAYPKPASAITDLNWRSDSARTNNDWHESSNWIPAGVPSAFDYVNIGHDCCQPQTSGPIVSNEQEVNYLRMRSRQNNDYTVTIAAAGSLMAYSEVTVGCDTYTYGPRTLTLDVDGGMLVTPSLVIGDDYSTWAGTKGVVNIRSGGVVLLTGTDAGGLVFQDDPETSRTSELNLYGDGLFVWEGDHVDAVNSHIASGHILAPGSDVHVSTQEGYTVVRAFAGVVTLPDLPDLGQFVMPEYIPHPATAKEGWWHWYAPRWWDLYRHDIVWEDGGSHMPTDSGIAGTGVHARLGIVYDGDMGLKVAGMTMYGLDGSNGAGGTPIHDPICNTWVQGIDWAEYKWATTLLAFHNLPAGEYALHSYHNNFDCYRQGSSNVACDSTGVQQPNIPSITAMALAASEDLMYTLDPDVQPSVEEIYDHYPYSNVTESGMDLGCGTGVQMLEADYDVQIQQVTSDSQLNTSLVKFRTDGSPVLIVYENGCCVTDSVRPGRSGGRAILNAFRLDVIRPVEAGPINPCSDDPDEDLNPTLRWWPSADTSYYDVYFGRAYGNVEQAVPGSPEHMGGVASGLEGLYMGYLKLNSTYHWRVDPVGVAGALRKGSVWTFTTTPCSLLEDFSSPWSSGYDPWMIWRGYGAAEGADYVSYVCTCGADTYEVGAVMPSPCDGRAIYPKCWLHHGDTNKALELEYYNLVTNYSEAGHIMCPGDWLGVDATAVSLWFMGASGNVSDRLYLRIEDADGSASEIEYGGPSDITTQQWQRWAIQLEDISGVDLTRVKRVNVGVGDRSGGASGAYGRLYIDDLRLCVPHCLDDAARPAKDHNSDCVVNFVDHAQDSAVTSGDMAAYADFAAVWLENTLWP